MKTRHLFFATAMLFAGVVFFAACEDKEKPNSSLVPKVGTVELNCDTILFAQGDTIFTTDILSEVDWEVIETPDWIRDVDPLIGDNSTVELTVYAKELKGYDRSGYIVFLSGEKDTTRIPVVQKFQYPNGMKGWLTAKRLTAASVETKKNFYVASTGPWKITTEDDWITINKPSEGTKGTFTISVTIAENANKTVRDGLITFKSGKLEATIPVKQVNETVGYWKDGEQIILHSPHDIPVGRNPVPIALVMDGFDLSDLKKCPNSPTPQFSGKFVSNYEDINSYAEWNTRNDCVYERFCRAITDLLLRLPVIRDFENYFDIRAYVAESNSRGKYDFTPFGWSWQHGSDTDKMRSKGYQMFGADYPGIAANDGAPSNVTYFFGANAGVGGFNMGDWCAISNPMVQQPYFYHLGHEFGGHTLGRIPDLYYRCSWDIDKRDIPALKNATLNIPDGPLPGTYTTNGEGKERDTWSGRADGWFYPCYQNQTADGIYSDCDVRNIVASFANEWKNGVNWNVDYENDPAKVLWKDFIDDPAYIRANGDHVIGVHPTAFNAMFCGFWGPEDVDCMKNTDEAHYNLGTRMWLWSKILDRAGVPAPTEPFGNWSDPGERAISAFKAFDTKHRVDPLGEITDFEGGYALHPRYVFKEDSILTQKYWEIHDIYPERQNKDGGGF
ncbi:MAG: hypothetical protein LBT48_03235 [Prevotellaceae bacterium]|jgi:hypothetical protein|nr:hypothetical protein [Prevotellaceae bacterium]